MGERRPPCGHSSCSLVVCCWRVSAPAGEPPVDPGHPDTEIARLRAELATRPRDCGPPPGKPSCGECAGCRLRDVAASYRAEAEAHELTLKERDAARESLRAAEAERAGLLADLASARENLLALERELDRRQSGDTIESDIARIVMRAERAEAERDALRESEAKWNRRWKSAAKIRDAWAADFATCAKAKDEALRDAASLRERLAAAEDACRAVCALEPVMKFFDNENYHYPREVCFACGEYGDHAEGCAWEKADNVVRALSATPAPEAGPTPGRTDQSPRITDEEG